MESDEERGSGGWVGSSGEWELWSEGVVESERGGRGVMEGGGRGGE